MANKEASKPRGEEEENESSNAIRVCGMQYAYEGEPPLFADFNLELLPGSRCLLVGANGSGKNQMHELISLVKVFPRKLLCKILNI